MGNRIVPLVFGGIFGLFGALPASSNYQLKSYDFGNGGGSGSSANYQLNGISGNVSGDTSSANYRIKSGEPGNENTNVPPAPTVNNPSSYYDRLLVTLNTGSNPSTAVYLIAVSTDGFVTTKYVQPDNTLGNSYTLANYQSYAAWGGASGFYLLGLNPSTTYEVKVRAFQGAFSESALGPAGSAATVAPSLSFGVSTTLSPTPPFTVNFSGLAPGTTFAGDADAQLSLTTNALNGGNVYVKSGGGLTSTSAGYTLNSATTNLASANFGYGAQVTAVSQASGGPLASVTPYDGSADNVGGLSTALQKILSTSGQLTSGSATVRMKAKTDFTVPSSTDYTDTLLFVAAMTF